MLEQLFGSKTRVRLLRLFLQQGKQAFFVRELSRRIGAQINAIRNELENLTEMGIVNAIETPENASIGGNKSGIEKASNKRKKYYRLNLESPVYPELQALFVKSRVMLEKDFVQRLAACGGISYLAMTGHFVGQADGPTDLLIVGRVNKAKLLGLIRSFEREIGWEINYTVMPPQEYKYRRDVTDRFLYSILESPKIVMVDTLSERVGIPAI